MSSPQESYLESSCDKPESRNVMRHVSLGMYNRSLEPLATNSTIASERPALWRNGRNCFALATSWQTQQTHRVKESYIFIPPKENVYTKIHNNLLYNL